MTPKTYMPISPAAAWNAEAAGLSPVRATPPATTPKIAEEEQDAHDAGNENAHDRALGDLLDVFDAGDAGVQHAVGTRVRDVAADRSADEGGDDQEVDLLAASRCS